MIAQRSGKFCIKGTNPILLSCRLIAQRSCIVRSTWWIQRNQAYDHKSIREDENLENLHSNFVTETFFPEKKFLFLSYN